MVSGEGLPLKLALDDPRWAAFVAGNPAATPFHHPSWAELLSRTYGYHAFTIAIADREDRLLAGLPLLEVRTLARRRHWVSLPFTDECPPLSRADIDQPELAAALAAAFEALHAPAVEVRGLVDGLRWHTDTDAVVHELALDADADRVRTRFSRSRVIRNIARAEREGVVVRRARNRGDLSAFYALHTRTRRRQGVPVQPRRFFELLWDQIIEPGLGFILLADAGGRQAVAGALFLASGGIMTYKFGASDVDSWPRRPNHLIFWTAIQEACARGDRRFDFGRTDLSNQGLRAFKSGWGAEERPLRYSKLLPRQLDEVEALPARALSGAIRRSPTWVCRGVGAAFYRYAGTR
jgi:CelD/BcsL family acetyltransferase involved in cellulose biosynthesis